MANRWGVEAVIISLGSKITEDSGCCHEIKRHLLLGRKAITTLDSVLQSRDITLPTKICLVRAMVFPVVTYRCELDHKEGWAPKNWCFQTLMLEKTLESPLDCKEIKPVNPKGNQPWILTGRTDAKDETQILWPPDAKMTLFTSGSGFPRPWCWERLNTKGERGGRGWDGWIASLTQLAWMWANFGQSWRKEKTGVL